MSLHEWRQNCTLPLLEKNMLIQKVTGFSHANIITRLYEQLTNSDYEKLNELTARRLAGEPMAYILGFKEFYSRNFYVSPAVLIPRPETECLVDFILNNISELPNKSLWDIGTGSGIIAITLKLERPNWRIIASDISLEALNVAKVNGQKLSAKIDWAQGSWYSVEPAIHSHSVDIIVANPPYIRQNDCHLYQGDLRFEPQLALTDFNDGLDAYRLLTKQANEYLTNDGLFCVEHGYDQAAAIRQLLTTENFSEINTFQDYANLDRFTVAKKKINTKKHIF